MVYPCQRIHEVDFYLRHVAGLQELLRIALAAVVFVVVGVIVGR